jgi:hypothetical protein
MAKVGVCGIYCEKCPKFLKGQCSGCGENPVCKMPGCAKKKGVEFCFECPEFPCPLNYEFFSKSWLDFLKSDKVVG